MTVEEDRISDLPDCMIHHILSFFPSTKEAIQTSILSKRWLNQWTHVPILIFDKSCSKRFLQFVDNTLSQHDCSKIKKLHLEYPYTVRYDDPQLDATILFATRKHVEELYLSSYWQVLLPEFLFNTASSLVKLTAILFTLIPDRKVNWGCLTALKLFYCKLTHQGLQHILSGSPLLELLELIDCCEIDKLVIASKSLKILTLSGDDDSNANISSIEISCPNLVELSFGGVKVNDANLFDQVIENVLSTSPLLKSFKLVNCNIHNLVIASKSLKKLVLSLNHYKIINLVISCPQLEILVFSGSFYLTTAKLHDLPSLLCATFDFDYNQKHYYDDDTNPIRKTVVIDILQKVNHHVKKLTIGNSFINILSTLVVGDPFPSLLNVKSLTLISPNLNNHYSGIARLLRHAPKLEKLVIDEPVYDETKLETLDDFGENYWKPDDAAVFNCLVSHLKNVKIIDFCNDHYELKFLMSFVQFLLNNARVLEKMILVTTNIPFKIPDEDLLQLPRCSNAIIELQ